VFPAVHAMTFGCYERILKLIFNNRAFFYYTDLKLQHNYCFFLFYHKLCAWELIMKKKTKQLNRGSRGASIAVMNFRMLKIVFPLYWLVLKSSSILKKQMQ
jgi:hypothetical protein